MTVISGTFNLAMGEKFDSSGGRALATGSFAFMPPGMKHFAWTSGETVIQVHGNWTMADQFTLIQQTIPETRNES